MTNIYLPLSRAGTGLFMILKTYNMQLTVKIASKLEDIA